MQVAPEREVNILQTFSVNSIVWIRSLPEEELGPSRRMAEDIEALAVRGGQFRFEETVVGTANELLAFLSTMAKRCREGLRPILHFDCHGTSAVLDGG